LLVHGLFTAAWQHHLRRIPRIVVLVVGGIPVRQAGAISNGDGGRWVWAMVKGMREGEAARQEGDGWSRRGAQGARAK
jgi:hypothetical protein